MVNRDSWSGRDREEDVEVGKQHVGRGTESDGG